MSRGYKNAIKKYSDAIIAAKDVPEALAPAFLNRATAEFKLGNYGKCLRDVDMSLRYEPGIVKVHYRYVYCIYDRAIYQLFHFCLYSLYSTSYIILLAFATTELFYAH